MENEKSNINYEKFYLLRDIKELNSKISRKQRAELYEPLKNFLTKPIFNQILRGSFVSENNIKVAIVLKNKMQELANKNEEYINSI
jgi:hypothetical protein